MKNLKVWQKLALMGLVFLIPFAVVTFKLVSSVNTLGVDFARSETVGLEYLTPLRDLMQHTQEHRSYAAAYLNGNKTVAGQLETSSEAMRAAISKLGAVDKAQNSALNIAEDWNNIQSEARSLTGRVQSLTPAQSFAQHTELIEQILLLSDRIGDRSKLTLDPDLDSSYLMNATVVHGPQVAELMGELHALGLSVAARGRATPAERTQMIRLEGTLEHLLEDFDRSLQTATEANSALKNLESKIQMNDRATQEFERVLERLMANPRASGITQLYQQAANNAIESHFALLHAISPDLQNLVETRMNNLQREVRNTLLQALLGLLVVGGIGFYLMRDITQPLGSAVTLARKIADGDLTGNLSTQERSDEIGALMTTLQSMTESLRDQTRRILDGVNVLGAASSQILASTSQVAAGATETAAAVTETTATVEEVKQTAQLSSQKARDVADTAQQSAEISYSGTQSVNEMVSGMERIREQMTHIAESVVHLSEQSQAIGDIINTVNDLAEQSNLLAVNAAIEAAKAGEQGKGFAVVAQEVKSLAEQSKQATTQVRTILNEVQKATGSAVMATEQGNKAVEAGLNQAVAAGHSIQVLAESIEGAAQSATQIAASSQEQLAGVDQVALAMNNIKEASTQNVSSMRQLESAARNLNDVGVEMRQLVEKYQV